MTRRAATRPPRTVHADALADALASAKGDGASLADWCEWRCRVCHADLTPAQVHLREGRVYCADHGPRDGVACPVKVLTDDVPGVLVEALVGGCPSVYARVARATHAADVLCVELRDGTTPYRDRYGWPATPEGVELARARVDAILADADARARGEAPRGRPVRPLHRSARREGARGRRRVVRSAPPPPERRARHALEEGSLRGRGRRERRGCSRGVVLTNGRNDVD